jgi:UDPglucose 6-dehydrogenase
MRVCMIGSGYVGLVTGACLAEIGHEVICVDKDRAKIERLLEGHIPIYEPGLHELVESNRSRGRLTFTANLHEAVARVPHFYFVAVGTPPHAEDGGADLSYVFAAVDEIASTIGSTEAASAAFSVIVTKSTVPVGTSREVARIARKHLREQQFAVASNPEFLREGNAIEDFMTPDRIIVGSQSETARTLLEELYRPLTRQGRPLVMTTTVETAELIKYAANAFLATKITFVNELSRLCERIGADVDELALGIGLDKRIGDKFLKVGPGYGGSCFPKDTLALVKTANDYHSPVEIVETVIRANSRHKHFMFNKIRDALGGSLAGKKIAVLGLAFKANTDDVRDSPAMTIVPILLREGASVSVYDPIATKNAINILGSNSVHYASSLAEVVSGVDAAVVLTEWQEFRDAEWPTLSRMMATPLIVDLRNIFTLTQAGRLGVKYISLGRNAVAE